MNFTTADDLSFTAWAKHICAQYPEILKHMKNSSTPLETVIATRILKNAEISDL